ncbi:lytic transglycosylase domain-containing protein [Olsenella profusa]|uniref:lytic transglycosylase domain-containing protein n=1 Tax=Olsenella profusa TaxID=138595 RepID=UPI00315AB3E8
MVIALALVTCAFLNGTSTTLTRELFYPVSHAETVQESAERHGVDPYLVCAVIKCESDWDESARSSAGAVGLMQLMPETAQSLVDLGVVDGAAYDPADLENAEVNIEYGCAYLGYLQEHLSSQEEVVAAYNAGIGAVQGWLADGGTISEEIEYAETRAYLERVLSAYEGYRLSYPGGITAS